MKTQSPILGEASCESLIESSIKYTKRQMKQCALPLSLLLTLSSQAAIYWQPTPTTSYTAGSTLNLSVDPTVSTDALGYQGIEAIATSSHDGNRFYTSGSRGGSIHFFNAGTISAGETITFTFDFNMQLESGPRQWGTGSRIRSAAMFRIGTISDGMLTATSTGGDYALDTYWNSPTDGDNSHQYINGTHRFEYNGKDFSYVNVDGVWVVDSELLRSEYVSHSGDSAVFKEGADNDQFSVQLYDPHRVGDYGFNHYTFEYTTDIDIAADTEFRFTFEGQNFDIQSLLIPEPSSSFLLGLGVFGLLSRRRR